jgi:hypothetical protein
MTRLDVRDQLITLINAFSHQFIDIRILIGTFSHWRRRAGDEIRCIWPSCHFPAVGRGEQFWLHQAYRDGFDGETQEVPPLKSSVANWAGCLKKTGNNLR